MERELIQRYIIIYTILLCVYLYNIIFNNNLISSKRAAQISHNITSLVLPTIGSTGGGAASVGHRSDQVENNSQNKRSNRKKR